MSDTLIRCEPLVRGPGHIKGVITMWLDHRPAGIWAALTQPQHLANWLAPGEIDLRPGGAVKLAFDQSGVVIDSEVTALQPERKLGYSWSGPGEPDRPIDWTITPEAGGAVITLTVQTPEGEDAARACAGWAAHLEMLAAAMEGVPVKFPFESFKARRAAYAAAGEATA